MFFLRSPRPFSEIAEKGRGERKKNIRHCFSLRPSRPFSAKSAVKGSRLRSAIARGAKERAENFARNSHRVLYRYFGVSSLLRPPGKRIVRKAQSRARS